MSEAITRNSERFLTAFRRIERWLETHAPGARRIDGFGNSINHFAKKNNVIRRFRDDLRQFAELRNAMVHEYAGEKLIAEPNDWTVERIEMIAQELVQPPRVLPAFAKQVITVPPEASVSTALRVMHEHGFSQVPVSQDTRCRGLLTGNTIARWLAARISEDIFSLEETTVADVLHFAGQEKTSNFRFAARDTTLFDVLDLFATNRAKRLEAVLITHSGDPGESLLGIITTADLPEVHHLVGLHGDEG